MRIKELYTDKARYAPGEPVWVTAVIRADAPAGGTLLTGVWHLENRLEDLEAVPVTANGGETAVRFCWRPPETDFTGYLLTASLLDENGTVADTGAVAVDVSSNWKTFPRYGYLWDFTQNAQAEDKIDALSKYHINGLQYYDWQYRHHLPLSPDTQAWEDWSGRKIDGGVVSRYIAAAKSHNMENMAYNMIYGANQTYRCDGSGVDPAWRLVKENGEDFLFDMDASLGDVGVLQFFNILNEGWQRYIFAAQRRAIEAFGFSGWHGDTVGEHGKMQTAAHGPLGTNANGEPVCYVKDGYTLFLNNAKKAMGDLDLMINPVGSQGVENVNVSDVDLLYTEFWPQDRNRWGEPYDSYAAIHREIRRAAEESGGKSLIVAAYINYQGPGALFNPPSVLLMDAVAFASGGARIELGNGDRMLSSEYFPRDVEKDVGEPLRIRVRRMYDFITAYQNLLRGGVAPLATRVELENARQTLVGESDAVWTFTSAGNGVEVLHLINLTGTDNRWRDDEGMKPEPTELGEIRVRYYTNREVRALYIASPDPENITPVPLPFDADGDAQGRCVRFTVPSLRYWDMVFLRGDAQE